MKGHTAFRPCARCVNVVLKRWWRPSLVGCVDQSCVASSLFVQHTAQSFQDVVRRLRACVARLLASKAELEELAAKI